MKIALINAVGDAGSTGKLCVDIQNYASQNKNEAIIFCGRGQKKDGCFPFAHKWEMKLSSLLSRVFGVQCEYAYFSTKRLIKQLKKFQPDIIHLHNLHGNYVSVSKILRYISKMDIPTVITLHDCWFFTGKCTHFTDAGCYKWKDGCFNCPQLKKDIPNWFFDKTDIMYARKKKELQRIKHLGVIGVSNWIAEIARESVLKNAEEIKTIYNWIDSSIFYNRENVRQKYGILQDEFVVLLISSVWKNSYTKTKDMQKLCNQLGTTYKIILVGKLEGKENLPENVKYFEYVSNKEVLAELYSLSDAYVHLSTEDTFGMVIVEALSCGTPVVIYNSTACPELVQSQCGFVVEPHDIDAIVCSLQKIRQDGKKSYSESCRKSTEKFQLLPLVQQTISLYEQIINSKD